MSRTYDKLTPEGICQHKRLNTASRRYLKTERWHLVVFVFIGWSVLSFGALYFLLGYWSELGAPAPKQSIHEQSATEQYNEVIESKLGQTGGVILQTPNEQEAKGSNDKDESEIQKTPLDYLSNARDLDAQEGVWKASRVIAIVALVQTIIGILGLVLVCGTLIYTRRAARSTDEALIQARESTRQAGFATIAAQQALEVTKKTENAILKVEYRVDLDDPTLSGNDTWRRITPIVTNYGNTPAFDVEFIFDLDFRHWRGELAMPLPSFDEEFRVVRHNIAARESVEFKSDLINIKSLIGEERSLHFTASQVSYNTIHDAGRIGPIFEVIRIIPISRFQQQAERRRKRLGPIPRSGQVHEVHISEIEGIMQRPTTYDEYEAAKTEWYARIDEMPRLNSLDPGYDHKMDDKPED